MNTNSIYVGIDVGSNTTKVVVLGFSKEKNSPYLITTGQSETNGMRQGYITNIDDISISIKKAVRQAEGALGYKIRRANISIGGISLTSMYSSGSITTSKSDQEITHLDISRVLNLSEQNLEIPNKKIIHSFPVEYKLDGKIIYTRPEGMIGAKLEVKTMFIVCLKQNLDDLITAFALANIEINEIIASPIALSNILLNTKEKTAGCLMLDIGSETVSMSVFENNYLVYLQSFAIGGMDITKDIALGFKISLDEAESLKLGSVIGGNFPKKKIDEIIDARLGDFFELIENHLKKIKRNELLPAGVIITGGGAHIYNIEDFTKKSLKLPVRINSFDTSLSSKYKIKDLSWNLAYSLALSSSSNHGREENSMQSNFNEIKKSIQSFFKQLLP